MPHDGPLDAGVEFGGTKAGVVLACGSSILSEFAFRHRSRAPTLAAIGEELAGRSLRLGP